MTTERDDIAALHLAATQAYDALQERLTKLGHSDDCGLGCIEPSCNDWHACDKCADDEEPA